jgi:hypothetical protein
MQRIADYTAPTTRFAGVLTISGTGALTLQAITVSGTGAERFTAIAKNQLAAYIGSQPAGFVVGGTAWDLTHTGRVGRRSLDLLVIDEAGQFSLASTIAVAASARRLLLLGDPQQLPQVSQGTHPEPVDTSALGWVMDDQSRAPWSRRCNSLAYTASSFLGSISAASWMK